MLMTWKQFQKWCNERACDGCWGYTEARICIQVLEHIRKLPFWRRKKTWEYVEPLMLEKIINPTNQKIEEIRRKTITADRHLKNWGVPE